MSDAVILGSALLLLAFIVLAECSTSGQFVVSTSLIDKSCPVDLRLFRVTDVNWTACSYLCWRRDECLSVNYQRDNKTCVGCSGGFPVLSDSHETDLRSDALFEVEPYIVVGGMKLRIVTGKYIRYEAAEDVCSAHGALVKLDTPLKKHALLSYVSDVNNGLSEMAFWLQCRYNTTAAAWMYDNGTPLMSDFWRPFSPDPERTYNTDCCHAWNALRNRGVSGPTFLIFETSCSIQKAYICEYN